MDRFLISLFFASVGTGLAALLLAILTPFLKKRFSARSIAALWLIATLGFLIPWRPAVAPLIRVNPPKAGDAAARSTPGAVQPTDAASVAILPTNATPNTVQPTDTASNAVHPTDAMPVAVRPLPPAADAATPLREGGFSSRSLASNAVHPTDAASVAILPTNTTPDAIRPLPPAADAATPLGEGGFSSLLSTVSYVFALWALGFLTLLFRQIYYYVRFLQSVRRWSEPVTDETTLKIFDDIKRRMTIRRSIRLLRSESAASPLMFGLTRPTILLPKIAIPDEELAFVLRHELTHYVRRDLWVRTASFLAGALHWFNPCAWLAGRMVGQFSELACDEQVTATENADGRRVYVEAILGVIKARHRAATVLTTQFLGGEKGMKQRIFSIMEPAPNRSGWLLLSATILLIVGAGMIFGIAEESPKGEMENGGDSNAASDAVPTTGATPDAVRLLTPTADAATPVAEEDQIRQVRPPIEQVRPPIEAATENPQPGLPQQKSVMYPVGDLLRHRTPEEAANQLESIGGTPVDFFPSSRAFIIRGDEQTHQRIADQLTAWQMSITLEELAAWRQGTKTQEEDFAGKTISYPFDALAEINLDPNDVIARLKTIEGVSAEYAPEFCRLLVTTPSNEAHQRVEETLDAIRAEYSNALHAAVRARLDRAILKARKEIERFKKVNEKFPGAVSLAELDKKEMSLALLMFKKTGETSYREQALAAQQQIFDRCRQLHEKKLLSDQEFREEEKKYRIMTEWFVEIGEKYPEVARELIEVEWPIEEDAAADAAPDAIPTTDAASDAVQLLTPPADDAAVLGEGDLSQGGLSSPPRTPNLTPFYFRLDASSEEAQKRLEALDWENTTRGTSTQKAPNGTLEIIVKAEPKMWQKIKDALRDLRARTPAMISSEMAKLLALIYAQGVPANELDLRRLRPKLYVPGVESDYTPSIPLDTLPVGTTPVWEGTLGRDIFVEVTKRCPQYNLAGKKIAENMSERQLAARVTADFVINALDGSLLAWREKSWPVIDGLITAQPSEYASGMEGVRKVEVLEIIRNEWAGELTPEHLAYVTQGDEKGNRLECFDLTCEYVGIDGFNADWRFKAFTKAGRYITGAYRPASGFVFDFRNRYEDDRFDIPDGATEFIGQAQAIEMGRAAISEGEKALIIDCRLDCRNSRAGYALIFWWPKPVVVQRDVEGKQVKTTIQSTVLFLDAFTGEVISTCEDHGGPSCCMMVTIKGTPVADALVECWIGDGCVERGTTDADGQLLGNLPPAELRVTVTKKGSDGKNEIDPKYADRTTTPIVINGAKTGGLIEVALDL